MQALTLRCLHAHLTPIVGGKPGGPAFCQGRGHCAAGHLNLYDPSRQVNRGGRGDRDRLIRLQPGSCKIELGKRPGGLEQQNRGRTVPGALGEPMSQWN